MIGASRYFAVRYFAPRYWPKDGEESAPNPGVTSIAATLIAIGVI